MKASLPFHWPLALSLSLGALRAGSARAQDIPTPGQTNAPISFTELGAKAGAQYQGDGLSVLPTREGARLRCVFQKLEGQATAEGLWLVSTADGVKADRYLLQGAVACKPTPTRI